jgi:hypothetical protein
MKVSAPTSGAALTRQAPAVERFLVQPVRRLLQWGPGLDGRLVIAAAIAVYVTVIAFARLVWGTDLWFLGVPPGPSLFFDARNLTAAWESQRLGYDPLYESPCDPRRRPLMYLRPWLLFGVFGLDQSHTGVLAVALIAIMFLTFAALVGRVPAGAGVILAVAWCSPAVMFALERANMDIALFSVLAAAVLLWRATPRTGQVLSPMLVLVAATAKIYPVFALPAFVFTRRPLAARVTFGCIAAFALYVGWFFRDIVHAAQIAIQGEGFSFGARILPAHLYHQVGADRWAAPALLKQLIAAVPLGLSVGAITLWVIRRFGSTDEEPVPGSASLLSFHAGALVYLGTFAVANNFDYRLVFLLLTLPQLFEWVCSPQHRLSSVAAVTLVAILVQLWVGSLSEWLQLWDELASWAVAGLLTALVIATGPSLHIIGRLAGAHLLSRPVTR